MAVPAGYTWVRELDPNAVYQGGMIKALGKTYKPGEYYLEGGRAYVPNPVPEGAQWIRSYFPGGQVSYNPATDTIELPGGLKLQRNALTAVGGKTYATPGQLAQAYQTYAATYRPPEATAEDIQKKAEQYAAIYNPIMETVKSRLGLEQQKITDLAEAQRRLAEAAWANALAGLGEQESQELRSTAHTVAGRGLSSSPLAEYQRRKVQEAFAKERTKLERDQAAQLANIATQASLAAYDLAQKGKEVEAEWASKIAEYAYNALQSSAAEQKKAVQTLADYFAGLAESEAEAQREAAKLAWEKEKAYLPYMYAPKESLLPYELGPTPYQQQSLAQQRELGLKEYLYGPTPYQQQSLAQQLQKQQQLSPTERTVDLRAQAANAVQAALDELWRRRPGGPSYAEVAETAKKALDQIKADLARAGMAKKDIDDTIELLKEYISAATGVPLEALGFAAAVEWPKLEVK